MISVGPPHYNLSTRPRLVSDLVFASPPLFFFRAQRAARGTEVNAIPQKGEIHLILRERVEPECHEVRNRVSEDCLVIPITVNHKSSFFRARKWKGRLGTRFF